jgi:hypothetical protein
LSDIYVKTLAYIRTCETAMNSSGILEHSSTTSVARDMLEIVTKSGQENLKYWGFSYGTILGGTFAAMYPERVERLVSDGNVDYEEWYNAVHINFLRDTDTVMEAFYDMCHQAGPAKCGLYDATPAAIKRRFEGMLEKLRVHPVVLLVVDDESQDMPFIVTYSKVKRYVNSVLYQPNYQFRRFSRIVAALERGDGWPFYEALNARGNSPLAVCSAKTISPLEPLPSMVEGTEDAFPVVLCADRIPLNETLEDMEEYLKHLSELSVAGGAVNAINRVYCNNRRVHPKWRFTGRFSPVFRRESSRN